jgi:signal peptidase I
MKKKINIKSITIMSLVIGLFYIVIAQFPLYKVSDESMSPNFKNGDLILTTNFIAKGSIEYEDVCVVKHDQEFYLLRIVALPGDKIEIVDAVFLVNERNEKNNKLKFNYKIVADSTFYALNQQKYSLPKPNSFGEAKANLTTKAYNDIAKSEFVKSIQKTIHPKGYQYTFGENSIFPNQSPFNWSRDNFGPIVIPKKGLTIKLTQHNLALFRRIIEVEEENSLQIKGRTIFINNEPAKSYTFKMDYFWMMADNRHHSKDARYWGVISENQLIAKFNKVIYSSDEKN